MNQRGFANVILIGAVFLLIAVGGYFAVGKKSEPVDQELESTTNNSETTSENETVSWKTYTNSKYGFEFKYNSKYQFRENAVGMPFFLEVELAKEGFNSANTQVFGVSISNAKLNDAVSFLRNQYVNVVVNQRNISGHNFTIVSFDIDTQESLHMEIAYIEYNGLLYIVDFSAETEVFLDTFKFTK